MVIPHLRINQLIILLTLLLAACINDDDDGPGWSIADGSQLPQFSVTTSDGTVISTDTFRDRGGVIVFFNTSCPDCRREFPILQQQYIEAGSDALYICIAREEDAESIAAYWAENNLTLPYSPQSDRKIYNLFATTGIPRIYNVSPDLTITETNTIR